MLRAVQQRRAPTRFEPEELGTQIAVALAACRPSGLDKSGLEPWSCPSSLLIQREWYRWWPYDERRNPGRRARALAEITRSMGRGAGQRNREGPQQSTRSD